jgi:trigger factor
MKNEKENFTMSTWTLKEKSMGDMNVTVEGQQWKDAVDKAFKKIAKNVKIDGFRKGHVPTGMIEKKVSMEERYAQAIEDNANEWMRDAFKELDLNPISQPQLDVKSMSADKAELVFTFAVMPEVELGEYKGLKYEMESVEVTDDEINDEIDRMRKQYADLETVEGEAKDGDTVKIDYEGFKDGVAFEGGKADGYNLKLGSGSFIPGFEDQLIGCKAGDEKELNLTFPEDYHAEDLKGAAVVFKVTVHEVTREVLPELDDDFAKDTNIPNVETVDDLKKTVMERLEAAKKSQAESAADEKLFEQLSENTKVDMPDALVDDEANNQIQQMAAQIQQYGLSFSQYLQMMGKTIDDLRADYRENAEKSVKLRLALNKIAEVENLEATDEDVEEQYHDLSVQYGMDVEKIKPLVSEELIRQDVKTTKAYNFVKDNAVKA